MDKESRAILGSFLSDDLHQNSRDPISYRDLILILTLDTRARELLKNFFLEELRNLPQGGESSSSMADMPDINEMSGLPEDCYPHEENFPCAFTEPDDDETEEKDTLAAELPNILRFLNIIESHPEIRQSWLDTDEDSLREQKIIRVLAYASDFQEIESLWTKLAAICNKEKRPATEEERYLLECCMVFYNSKFKDNKASLIRGDSDVEYNEERHQRATPTPQGKYVREVWLPGIRNNSGETVKKPLVKTDG